MDPPSPPRMRVEDIDLGFVPRRAFGTELSQVGDRFVLVKGERGRPHELNASGALAWRCFDGSVSLGTLAEEIAGASGTPTEVVGADLVDLARQLGGAGLLARVAPSLPTSTELDLVVACCRARLPGAAPTDLEDLAASLGTGPADPAAPDWGAVVDLAVAHRCSAAVRALARVAGPGRVPGWVADALAARLADNARRTRVLAEHLERVVAILDAAGIRALALKGPVLARTAFGAVDAREYRDLDLLVARPDFARARRALVAAGYHPRPVPDDRAGPQARVPPPGRSHEVDLTDAADGVVVDLHRGLAPRLFRCDPRFEPLWSRHVDVSLGGRPLPTPSVEDTVGVLAVQIAKDAWERRLVLSKLVDLATVAVGADLDLDATRRRARAQGQFGLLWFSLGLSDEVLGPLALPDGGMGPPPPAIRARIAETRRDLALGGAPRGAERRARFHADLRERGQDRIGPFVRWYVVPTDEDLRRPALPGQLEWLHLGLRPMRMLGRRLRPRPDGQSAT